MNISRKVLRICLEVFVFRVQADYCPRQTTTIGVEKRKHTRLVVAPTNKRKNIVRDSSTDVIRVHAMCARRRYLSPCTTRKHTRRERTTIVPINYIVRLFSYQLRDV